MNLSGAKGMSHTLSNVQFDANGTTYRCIVSLPYGTVTSSSATLTVGYAPAISTQPADQNVVSGSNPTFSVVATGTAPLSYQWQKNKVNLSGATGMSHTLSNVQFDANGTTYRCIVSNPYGTVTSSSATLTVGLAPAIATHPASQDAAVGSSPTFSVVATGTAPLSYHWQ